MPDFFGFLLKAFLVSVPILAAIVILMPRKKKNRYVPKRVFDYVLAGFLICLSMLWAWQAWFDTLPQDYCATTEDFNVLDKTGILAAYFPGNTHRSDNARRLCKANYAMCNANRYCTKTLTLGYDKW